MSYGLLGNPASGKNDRVTFADIILSGEFTLNLSVEMVNDLFDGFVFSGGTSGGGFELYRRSTTGSNPGGGWAIFVNGTSVTNSTGSTWPYYDGVTPNPRTIEISRNAANLITVKNPAGGTELTYTYAGNLKINTLFSRSGGSFFRGMLFHSLEISNGAFYRKYDASLSGGSGAVLPTNDGVNQGTLVNFPIDSSHWVFYEGGAEPVVQEYSSGGVVNRNVEFIAVSAIVQEQVFATSGAVATTRNTVSEGFVINEQVFSSAGQVSVNKNAVATTSFIDEQVTNQEYSSGGIVSKTTLVQAVTSFIQEQVVQSAGVVSASRSAIATTSFVDEFTDGPDNPSNDPGWGGSVPLFEEVERIYQISLTFDQLGRPLVFYKTESNQIKLYWYNPEIGGNVIEVITAGYDPVACFDFPEDSSQPFSDILLFYVRDNTVYMRIQRDRFEIEYNTGVTQLGVRLESAGLRVDNRLQVVYTYPEV